MALIKTKYQPQMNLEGNGQFHILLQDSTKCEKISKPTYHINDAYFFLLFHQIKL